MVGMSQTTALVVSLILLGLTLALPIMRRVLKKKAVEAKFRDELVQEFHESAIALLKITDPNDHSEMREVVMTAGALMMDGTRLIRGMVFFSGKRSARPSKGRAERQATFDSLPEDAKHALAKSLGIALLVSSCNSLFLSRVYRSILLLVLSEDDREIKQPAEILGRLSRKGVTPLGNGGLAA